MLDPLVYTLMGRLFLRFGQHLEAFEREKIMVLVRKNRLGNEPRESIFLVGRSSAEEFPSRSGFVPSCRIFFDTGRG